RLLRRQAIAMTYLLAATGFATAQAFKSAFPTAADRQLLARQLGANPGFQALYGVGRHLDTISGFTAWRFAGASAVIAAVWGLLAATRLIRGEEEAGRADLALAGAITRTALPVAAVTSLATYFGVAWIAVVLG